MIWIGLTGGMGCGKSAALNFFQELNCGTESADRIVSKLYKNPEILAKISKTLDLPDIDDDLKNHLENDLENRLENDLKNRLENDLENRLENDLENRLENDLENRLENDLKNRLENDLENRLENDLENRLENDLKNRLENDLEKILEKIKSEVSKKVFTHSESEKLRALEIILHPQVRKKTSEAKHNLEKSGYKISFYEIPLLFEKNLENQFDKTVCIGADEQIQINRIKKRNPNWSDEEIKNRLKSQMSLKEKKDRADFYIDNSGDLANLKENCKKLLSSIAKHCRQTL